MISCVFEIFTLTSGMNPISFRWLLSSGSWNAIICEKTVRYSGEVKNKSIQPFVLVPKTLLTRYTHGRTNTLLKAQSESKTKQFCSWSADSWASKRNNKHAQMSGYRNPGSVYSSNHCSVTAINIKFLRNSCNASKHVQTATQIGHAVNWLNVVTFFLSHIPNLIL